MPSSRRGDWCCAWAAAIASRCLGLGVGPGLGFGEYRVPGPLTAEMDDAVVGEGGSWDEEILVEELWVVKDGAVVVRIGGCCGGYCCC